MNKWEKIFWKLLFPNKVLIFFLVNISAALLVYAFCAEERPEAAAYVSYGFSAYALTVVCARMPELFEKIKKSLHDNKYTNRILNGKTLRIRISLYGGMVWNSGFAVFKVVMGILYQSKWLFAMAGYNVILSGMRFLLIYRDINDRNEENDYEKRVRGLHSYKVCGWLMLLLNMAITVIVAMVVLDKHRIVYPGFMIYAIAAFTFYCMTMAIINMVKYWQRHNPIFAAVKRIGMAKALVSLFTLQVAMITQFGGADGINDRAMNGITGLAVCVITTLMAVLMLTGVKKDYERLNQESLNQEMRE